MKASRKVILLASVLCLYPLLSNAAIRKINSYKQNVFTSSLTNCKDPDYRAAHPDECRTSGGGGNVTHNELCQREGYNTSAGPANQASRRCFVNPDGATIGGIKCYKWKSLNETNSSFPYDSSTCPGVPGGNSSHDRAELDRFYDCNNGVATEHVYYSECNCPNGTTELRHLVDVNVKKYFSNFDSINLPDGRVCIKDGSIQCKNQEHALKMKVNKNEYKNINNKQITAMAGYKGGSVVADYQGNEKAGKLSLTPKNLYPTPVFVAIAYPLDPDVTFACVDSTTIDLQATSPAPTGSLKFGSELNDGTYALYNALCFDMKMGTVTDGSCKSSNDKAIRSYVYHTLQCSSGYNSNPNAGHHCANQSQTSGTVFSGWKDSNMFQSLMCYKCNNCSSAQDNYSNGELYGLITGEAFAQGTSCSIGCNTNAGYIQVYKGDTTGCSSSFCQNGLTSIPGNQEGFTNGNVKFVYTLSSITKGAGTLVCALPTGCNVSAGYSQTTGCSTGSWCSWYNQ